MKRVSQIDWSYFGAKAPSMTTLAYWVLAPKEGLDLSALTAEALRYRLSSQCGAEDQACVGDDDCVGDPEFFNGRFHPLAPVQFVLQWSPFPYLVSIAGEPVTFSIDTKFLPCVAAIWAKKELPDAAGVHIFSPQVRKFERRAHDLVREGFSRSSEVCVVATQGWSYSRRKLGSVARRALRTHGFAFDSRAP